MSGNGVDLAAIYQLLSTVAADVRNLQTDVRSLQTDMRNLQTKDGGVATKDDLARLRQTIVEYHSAVIGHGILISELDDRVRRIEQHLALSPQP